MKILVDADACPVAIKEIIIRAAVKRNIATLFVANKFLSLPVHPLIRCFVVSQGMDVADQHIVDVAEPGDLVITQDVPLAAILVSKHVAVISIHGRLYTEANIGERLSIRNFSQSLRDVGVQTFGPKPFSAKNSQEFANSFDKELTKLQKNI